MARKPVPEIEEWRPVPGCPGYEASNLGRVKSLDRMVIYKDGRKPRFFPGVVLRPNPGARYHAIRLGVPNTMTTAHVIICEIFNGPRPSPDHEVAHWNGNGLDNRASNLRWATHKENKVDEIRHGRRRSGIDNGYAKLTEADIRAIRKLRVTTELTIRAIRNQNHCTIYGAVP